MSFEEIGKIIGSRWRAVRDNPNRVSNFALLATVDAERYAKDIEMYNQRKQQMSRSTEISSDTRCTIHTPCRNMHYYMHYQQQGVSTHQSGIHYGRSDYNNVYQTNVYASNGFVPSPMTGFHSAYHRSDVGDRRNHNANNTLEQNSYGMIAHNSSGNYNSHGYPMPMSDYQALPREYASYPYEQHSNIQYPHYQAYPAREPQCRHDASYSDNRGC